MESIKKRTSIRKYADREVTDELLNSLLEEAMRTPTMGNLQLYSVVVTRSEEGKKALAPAHFNQPMVTGAPVVLTICADYPGIRQHPLVYECGYRCPALYPDIHQSGRRGGSGNLLPGHHGVYAENDHRHPEVAEAGNASGYPYHRMAG